MRYVANAQNFRAFTLGLAGLFIAASYNFLCPPSAASALQGAGDTQVNVFVCNPNGHTS